MKDSAESTACPVLIVEDDEDLRDMMAQMLTIEGFHATTVANGREALDYLHTASPPHVILLDLMMPVRDGGEFRRRRQHASGRERHRRLANPLHHRRHGDLRRDGHRPKQRPPRCWDESGGNDFSQCECRPGVYVLPFGRLQFPWRLPESAGRTRQHG